MFSACSNEDLVNIQDNGASLRSLYNPLAGKWKHTSEVGTTTSDFYLVFTECLASEYSVRNNGDSGINSELIEINYVNESYSYTDTHFNVTGESGTYERPYRMDGNQLIIETPLYQEVYVRCEETDNPLIGKWEMVSTVGENTVYYYLAFSNEKASEYLIEESNPTNIQYHYKDMDYTYNDNSFVTVYWDFKYKRPYRIENNQLIIDYPTYQEIYNKVD